MGCCHSTKSGLADNDARHFGSEEQDSETGFDTADDLSHTDRVAYDSEYVSSHKSHGPGTHRIVWQENEKSKMSNGILASFNHCNNNVGQQKSDEKECEAIINF